MRLINCAKEAIGTLLAMPSRLSQSHRSSVSTALWTSEVHLELLNDAMKLEAHLTLHGAAAAVLVALL
jgi:hypothetical protein